MILLGALLLGEVPEATAQYPKAEPGRFEVPGFDFSPDGAWRRRAREVRAARRQMLAAGAIAALNAPGGPQAGNRVAGTVSVPVVPVRFSNAPAPFPQADYQSLLFASVPVGRPYSLTTYYQELSNGNITMGGTVFPWVNAVNTDAYYEDGCNGIGVTAACANPLPSGVSSRFAELLVEALTAVSGGADSLTVWAAFDNDGPDGVPNSADDDGFVDFVTFLQPKKDGACGPTSSNRNIWAHRWVISALNGGSPFVTKTPSTRGGFIKVRDYTIQSAVGGNGGCTDGQLMPIGTVAHETGHAFGLPDLYDTGAKDTEGIGEWGLMGSGNWARPYSPARMEAWSLVELGWVGVRALDASGTVRLPPVATWDTVLLVQTPVPTQHLLLENRQPIESDSAMMGSAFSRPKAPGLLVWHIDQAILGATLFSNTVNAGDTHAVALYQADGLNELRTPGANDRGDIGDPYPGATVNRRLSATSSPALRTNAGNAMGVTIDSIYLEPSQDIVFRFTKRGNTVVAPSVPGPQVRVNGALHARFEDVVPPGETLALTVDSVQASGLARTRFLFAGWSDGLSRTHSIVSSAAAPDTVTAAFEVQHEVRTFTAGSGAGGVTASAPGTPSLGIFVSQGTPVTLTATALGGSVFAGWSGDTTTSASSVVLPMGRP